jgi:hypothetical protein
MRVKASLQFSCATTGRNLETQLITDTRNLVIFRRGTVAMRCAFCGLKHYWRLIKYHRQDIPDAGAIASRQKGSAKKNGQHSRRPPSLKPSASY